MLPPRDPLDPPLFPEAGPSSPNRPSIFELLAEDQLRDLFHPVVRYVLSYFAQRHPRYLLKVLNYHEEFFSCLLLLIERYHLKKHIADASVSEHFYQLHLVPASRYPTPRSPALKPPRALSRRQRWGMLLFLVGIPYVRARLQDYYERLARPSGGGETDRPLPNNLTRPQRVFKAVYPYANLSYDLLLLVSDLRYLFDRTDAYRPWHRWLGLRVERRDQELEADPNPIISWTNHLPPLLPPLLLALKLSQWWYSPSSPRAITSPSDSSLMSKLHRAIPPPKPLPILPESGLLPPTSPTVSTGTTDPVVEPKEESSAADQPSQEEPPPPYEPSGIAINQGYTIDAAEYGRCPLCQKKWQNPAILPSGWVVCWRCGWDAIEGEDEDEPGVALVAGSQEKAASQTQVKRRRGKCPITGMDVGVGQLRRVLI